MSDGTPRISVIVPAYNSERFLPQALDSLFAQTLQDIEVVVVDDGSSDGTGDILAAYRKTHPNLRCITQENQGVSAARNNALAAATGLYVTFLDADDYYAPDTLSAFAACAEKTNADVILGRLCMVENGKETGFHAMADELAKETAMDIFDKRLLWNFLVSNKCYRRAFLSIHDIRFPATGFSEEGAFFMDAVYAGAVIAGTAESVVYYRRHTAAEGLSVSQTANVKNLESLDGSMKHIYASAEAALSRAGKTDRAYLQEIIYKHLHILASQFYRELWHMSEEALALCTAQICALLPQLSAQQVISICKANPDLNLTAPCGSRTEAAAHPMTSVVVTKTCTAEAAKALFLQSSPLFELLLTPRAAADLPEEILALPNVHVNRDASPKAAHVLHCGVLPVYEPGVLQLLYRAGLPAPGVTAKVVDRLLKWRHKR